MYFILKEMHDKVIEEMHDKVIPLSSSTQSNEFPRLIRTWSNFDVESRDGVYKVCDHNIKAC